MGRERQRHCLRTGTLLVGGGMGKSTPVRYEMRFIDASYLEEVMALQQVIVAHLEDQQLFAPDTRAYLLEEVLAPGMGKIIGVFAEGHLVAYRSVSLKAYSDIDFVKVLNIPAEELTHVATLVATVVHPRARGNRLQEKLLEETILYLRGQGFYHLFTTVSPCNYPSLKSVMGARLTVKNLKKIYGEYEGKVRLLLTRDLRQDKGNSFSRVIALEPEDIISQKKLLAEGYEGFGVKKHHRGFHILYGIRNLS